MLVFDLKLKCFRKNYSLQIFLLKKQSFELWKKFNFLLKFAKNTYYYY